MKQKHLIAPLLALLAACASAPTSTSLLEQARAEYQAARDSADVTRYAPVELGQAGEALAQASEAAARNDSINQIDRFAYIARQRSATAQEVARQKAAEAQIATAASERDQLRLQQRTQEADQARQQAQTAEQKARLAEAAGREAQARAAQLEAQLADLSARKTERGTVITFGDVLFATNEARLTPEGMRTARKLAVVLLNYPQRNVLIEGFTDSTGSSARNLELSQRRADAVRQALLGMGIGPERITTAGYGAAYPVAGNESAAERQINRRVEIVLSEEGGAVAARR